MGWVYRKDDIELEPRFNLGTESLSAGITYRVRGGRLCARSTAGGLLRAVSSLWFPELEVCRRPHLAVTPSQGPHGPVPKADAPFAALLQVDDENKLRAIFDMGSNEVRCQHTRSSDTARALKSAQRSSFRHMHCGAPFKLVCLQR